MKFIINKMFRLIRRMTAKKVINLALAYFQQYIQKGDISLAKPAVAFFDPSSICNLHCPLCPNGQRRKGRTRIIMPLDQYKKTVDDLSDSLIFIHFSNWGEPLANKNLPKMIRYANDHNIDTTIYTNLTLLGEKAAGKIIKAGVDEIVASIDGATETTYLKYRVGGNFQKVMNGLKLLVKYKREYHSPVLIKWQFIVSSKNEIELEKAAKMARVIGVDFLPVKLRIDMGKEADYDRREVIGKNSGWFPKTKVFQRYNSFKLKETKSPKSCYWLWTKMVINANGSVSPCCSIWNEKDDFGNAFNDHVLSIWNNERYQRARKIVRTKKAEKGMVCSNCLKNSFIS